MKSGLIDRLALVATLLIFCGALAVLWRESVGVSPRAVLARLAAMPPHQILVAAALTAANYLCLSGYDFLALRYARRPLHWRGVLFASFTAFAFSNGIGFQLLSGSSIRYRLYSSYGLSATDIGKIIVFCSVAYALGVITLGGLLMLTEPSAIVTLLHLPRTLIVLAGLTLLAGSLTYLALAAWRRPLRIGRFTLAPPSLTLGLAQIALAMADAVLAGTVMYALLPADFAVSYPHFLAVYLIAATTAVVSLVPAGLGVFESAVILLTVPKAKAAVLGAFLAYRVIYFALPLVVAVIGYCRHELRGRPRPPG